MSCYPRDMSISIDYRTFSSFLTATGAAIAAGFVAFGHTDLAAPAQAAFVAVAGLVVATIHRSILGGGGSAPKA